MNGKFITIEGGEGAGKTTVLNTVVTYLAAQQLEVVVTREPGGTEIGEKIRSLLLDKDQEEIHADTELLLMFAARAQHWQAKIYPALQRGAWVVSDRFVDSSFAYQGGGREMDMARIETLAQWTLGTHQPDVTLLLDLEPKIGMERAKKRADLDRFEEEELAFFHRVRAVFLARAAQEPKRFSVINAAKGEAEVQAQVLQVLAAYAR